MHKKNTWFLLLLLLLAGCKTVQEGLFTSQTPHEEYMSKLANAGLDNNILGQSWILAAADGMQNPVSTEVPYSEALVFDFEQLTAAAYQLTLTEGQNLHVLVEPERDDTTEIFIDLFRFKDSEFINEAHAEKDSVRLDYRVRRGGDYILRIQPELLARGLYTVFIFTDASLNFPVPDRDFNSISSFFGDPRDGGGRRHEGVDVFAPRGTPALAVSSGRVSRTGTNRLGGKVVWVSDTERGYNYYYAHLDSQLVRPGMRVTEGDTIGLIGNTGNAITTPPHLHFGIYAFGRRSIDPYVFFHRTEMPVIDSLHITQYAGNWGFTTSARTNFRNAPGLNADIKMALPPDIPLKIRGVSDNWLRVELPDGELGYIYRTLVKPANDPIEEVTASGVIIRSRPDSTSHARHIVRENKTLQVFAQYNDFLLVQSEGRFGWIRPES